MATRLVSGKPFVPMFAQVNTPPYVGMFVIPVKDDTVVLEFSAMYLSASAVKEVRCQGSGPPSVQSYGSQRRFAQGIVKQENIPVSRKVCAYNRESKQLLASTMSDQAGHFYLTWAGYSGKFFVLVFDDETDSADYNCQVFDLLDSLY